MKPRSSLLIAVLVLTGGVLAAQTITISPDGKSATLLNAAGERKVAVRLNQTMRTSPVVLGKASSRLTTTADAMKASPTTSGAPATTTFVPGQTVFVGSTPATRTVMAARPIGNAAADVVVVSATGADAESAATALSANPLAATIERQVFRGDLLRDLGGPGLLPGTRTVVNGDFVIGQNGFPVPITTAAAAASGPAPGTVIGPNGFPVPVTQAQAASPVIGPNGFPTTAASAQTGMTRGITTIPTTVSQGSTDGGVSTPAAATTVRNTTVSTGPAIGSTAGATTSGVGGASPQ